MSVTIHPTAIVASTAQLDDDVFIGPYSIVGPFVTLGKGVHLKSHVVIDGHTTIGEYSQIFPFASIGMPPQDKKYKGEASQLIIGARNIIREYTTMNPGTEGGGMVTTIGDECLFMVSTHVAHDCRLGNHIIMANNATLAGHVVVGDYAIIGGLSAVHQFVRIGAHAMIGGMSAVERDVIPYGAIMGERASLAGLNVIGMKRRGFSRETIHSLRAAYQALFTVSEKNLHERIEQVAEEYAHQKEIMEIIEFLQLDTSRAICTPKQDA